MLKKKDKSSRGLAFKSLKECDPHRRGCTWSDLGDVCALGRTSTPPHPPHSHGNPIDAFFCFCFPTSFHVDSLFLSSPCFLCKLEWEGMGGQTWIFHFETRFYHLLLWVQFTHTRSVTGRLIFFVCVRVCVCEHDSPSLPPSLPVTQWLTCTDVSTNEIPPPLSLSRSRGKALYSVIRNTLLYMCCFFCLCLASIREGGSFIPDIRTQNA